MEPNVIQTTCSTDWIAISAIIFSFISSAIGIIACIYAFLRNFKTDVNNHIDSLEKRIDSLDERMFYLSTGRTLAEAIKAERMKLEYKE
jgi:hypothetical protein